MPCECSRVLRLDIEGEPHWICAYCNDEYVPKRAVDYKLSSLGAEVMRLGGIEKMAEALYESLVEHFAISPMYSEEAADLLQNWRRWKDGKE